MEGVPALWQNVGFLAGETEAKAEGLQTDGALLLVVFVMVVHRYSCGMGGRVTVGVGGGLVAVERGRALGGGGGVGGTEGAGGSRTGRFPAEGRSEEVIGRAVRVGWRLGRGPRVGVCARGKRRLL